MTYCQLRCMNCGEQPEHWQYVTISEWLEVPGSRGEANLIEKCKLCGRFDCRGVEPTDFDPRVNLVAVDGGWRAVGIESGTKFDDVDLSEKVWHHDFEGFLFS
uniref:Uncharacterized protein n=1 Tax=Parascaris equorum TaxID=6256 RepID=A0A914SGU8_PAREQ